MKVGSAKDYSIVAVLLVSFATYTVADGKELWYAASLLVILAVAALAGVSFNRARLLIIICAAYAAVVVMSIAVNHARLFSIPVQSLLYPLVFWLSAGMFWRLFSVGRRGAFFVLALFLLNALVSFLGVFFIDSIPLFGDIQKGRVIFGTGFPSSAGLVWNVNYYAATQAVGFWIVFALYKHGSLPRWVLPFIFFIALSVIFGSSRSCTAALIASIAIYRFLESGFGGRTFIFGAIVLFALSASTMYVIALDDPSLNADLRLYKGLNNRDDLWGIGLDLVSRVPVFGYGSVAVMHQEMLMAGSITSTPQNSALTMQLLFGAGGFLVYFSSFVVAIARGCTWSRRPPAGSAVLALLLFVLLDSAVRSYVLGGLGVIPLVMVAAISYLARQPNSEGVDGGK